MTVDELLTKLDRLPGEAQVFMKDEENFVIDLEPEDIKIIDEGYGVLLSPKLDKK